MKRGKVLIIDDDEQLLDTARTLLERDGFGVAVYSGRFDRMGFVVREAPDLVLLDVNMPVVPGDELYALFREHSALRDVPVVFFFQRRDRSATSGASLGRARLHRQIGDRLRLLYAGRALSAATCAGRLSADQSTSPQKT